MTLQKYLDTSINSTVKETIFNYRLFYDIKIAAAQNNNDVQIYLPEIDRKGYDIILDDNDNLKPIQIKTVNRISSGHEWKKIHKNLIRPNGELSELIFMESSSDTVGLQGGLIVIHPILTRDQKDIKEIHYYYTDIVIIACYFENIIRKYNTSQKKAKSFLSELKKGNGNGKITIPIHLMVKAKDTSALLALCGLHSTNISSYLSIHMTKYLKAVTAKERKQFKKEIKMFLRSVSNDRELKYSY